MLDNVSFSLTKRASLKRRMALSPPRVTRLLPNMVTVFALCVGMTSIRFALIGEWSWAVSAILLAAFFDGMDGRLARFLQSTSDFGAELDSLADFVAFGVSPACVLYLAGLHQWGGFGWAFCLFFATCMALRLARFNVHRLVPTKIAWGGDFFIGVPAPAGAFVGLLPLIAALGMGAPLSPTLSALSLTLTGLLMVSRVPTYAFKNVRLSPKRSVFVLGGGALLAGAMLTAPWTTLVFVGCAYLVSLPFSLLSVLKRHRRVDAATQKN